MKKLAVSLPALLILALPAHAFEQGFGFSAGATGGVGTHYRAILDNGWGYGGALSLWSAGSELAYVVGANALRVLAENRQGRLYAVAGLGIDQPQLQSGTPALWGIGGGIGIQLGRSPGVTFSLEGQLTALGNQATGWNVLPLPGIALTYFY